MIDPISVLVGFFVCMVCDVIFCIENYSLEKAFKLRSERKASLNKNKRSIGIFGRLKHWLKKNKGCSHCCLFCEFYDECKDDLR